MEIKLVKRSGVPSAEVAAHQEIQKEFDAHPFTKRWRGYASFAVARPGRGAGDDDLDLVLVTHSTIAIIELKNWHGKLLESDGKKWFLDGQDHGDSPVSVVNRKVPKLASLMKQKLGVHRTPFIQAYVLMHGNIGTYKLTKEEEGSVMNMAEFLSLRFEQCYRRYFSMKGRFNPLDHLREYDGFFLGPTFRPKTYYVDGFKPGDAPIFEHPRKLYSEFAATARENVEHKALLRQWNFGALGLDLLGDADRVAIGLREQRIFNYVSERNPELSIALLRPIAHKSPKDVTMDFAELYAVPGKIARLAEFTHSMLPKVPGDERLGLFKSLLALFSDLHDLNIAHRDVGDHSVWLDRPAKVIVSGFPAAYFPQTRTVGAFRERVRVEDSALPEDIVSLEGATPYRRDVFQLAVLGHQILYGEKPPKANGHYAWSDRDDASFGISAQHVLARALSPEPSSRYANARDMLEALNAATVQESSTLVDPGAFDAFNATTKERDYELVESLVDEEHFACFRTIADGAAAVVKMWYGLKPSSADQALSLQLLSRLERARAIKGANLPGIPRVIDFGITRGSTMLVLEWVDGSTLSRWSSQEPELARRMAVARSMVDTLIRLHDLELPHGDIHPENIIVRSDDSVAIIDMLDFRFASDAYTTQYLPAHYKSLSPFERDRYGLAAVLVELLGSSRERPSIGRFPIPRVYEELNGLLSSDNPSSLDPLKGAIARFSSSGDVIPEFTVSVANLAYEGVPEGELRSDNGAFHVSAQKDKRVDGAIRFWVVGVGRQVSFTWRPDQSLVESVKVGSVPQSQLLRSQQLRDAAVKMRLSVEDAPQGNADELAHHLLTLDGIRQRLKALASSKETGAVSREEQDEGIKGGPERTSIELPITDLWKSFLAAEEEAFVTVTIAGEKRSHPYRHGQILVPYHMDVAVIDFEVGSKIIVENVTPDGDWRTCGTLNIGQTSFGEHAELAIDDPHIRVGFRIGDKLRLRSTSDISSFTRRRAALERLVDDKAVVPGLIWYFDRSRNAARQPTEYSSPSDAELDAYSTGTKKLNRSQREAFRRAVSQGPISLLQGPPGTGKTWFIASVLHYLMTKERARRILLVSQSHEAVNNALEKCLEFCQERGVELNAVRLGQESASSDVIRHLHASTIEQSYRARFRSEHKERVAQLGGALGLPREFCAEVVALDLRLGTLCERIGQAQQRTGRESESEITSLDARARALTETFFEIAEDCYQIGDRRAPADILRQLEQALIAKHGVRSEDAIQRLYKLLRLSAEWLSALGSPDANFAEFLAKSRTLVAGTLVGIGFRATGVTQNVFDWVIVDEAGRASSSELAVAMQAGNRILLVGDHRQLPPTFSDGVKKSLRERFPDVGEDALLRSDFDRVFSSEYGRRVGSTLLTQYRMAPTIGELVSTCFYDGTLENGRGESPDYYKRLPHYLSHEVTWVDTSPLGARGHEQETEDGEDRWNESEARLVMVLLQRVLESEEFLTSLQADVGLQDPPIGVICLYSKQRERIDQLKAEAPWLGEYRNLIKVDTVDSYQGKENRIVIVSTVRNNPGLRPGFLRSPNRINVAISRAMERLIIVGSSAMWAGRNSKLPLGHVLGKVTSLVMEGRAAMLNSAEILRE